MRKLDMRIISATNCELAAMVRRGEFREDLYYRLNVFPIHVPPLRRRVEDIPLLVDHLLHSRKRISDNAIAKLMGYSFPGNIRELENIVEAAVCMVSGSIIHADDILLPNEALTSQPDEDIIIVNFWESVARPFADRLITRTQMQRLARQGLQRTRGSYRKMLPLFRIPDTDYKRFMDFLRRHHCIVDFREYRRK